MFFIFSMGEQLFEKAIDQTTAVIKNGLHKHVEDRCKLLPSEFHPQLVAHLIHGFIQVI
jgi:hypothetical protein